MYWLKLIQLWPLRALLRRFLYLPKSHCCVVVDDENFLTGGTRRCSRVTLHFPCPVLEPTFPGSPGSLYWNDIQEPRSGHRLCSLLLDALFLLQVTAVADQSVWRFIKLIGLFKEPAFSLTDISELLFCFKFIDFCSYLYDFFSSTSLSLTCSLFSSVFFKVNASITYWRPFFYSNILAFNAITFPLCTDLAAPHKFDMLYFLFIQFKVFFNSLETFSLTHGLFRCGLFNFHIFEDFPDIFLLLLSGLIPLWFMKILSVFLFKVGF